ncbi:hypothetical protein [Streptomyces violascens]|uniref:hypothetical protein n=1 Tax=Streptomyces violascens TaxID=67381 RepID=UPI0016738138|nr:hypothetical protein [Streptomyces violascens]GGU49838.1 hypothetical protein GCM10010289_82890 [Streptomyces violascens]
MTKLTDRQETALRLVLDNPGRVVAYLRGERDYLTINGNTEGSLQTRGLIHAVHAATGTRTLGRTVHTYDITVWELTPAGYEALGIEDPAAAPAAAEDDVDLPLPAWFAKAYEAELAETHTDADDPANRRVRDHVINGRTRAPRWLLGHLADVAALLAYLTEASSDLAPATRAARRRGCAQLLDVLRRQGVNPWPGHGHGVRPWGQDPAHCDDCAAHVGPRPPADVIAAELTVDQELDAARAEAKARRAAQQAQDEDEIAAEHGEHMRPGALVRLTWHGKTTPGVVQSVYRRANGQAGADVLLPTGKAGAATADQLAPLPERTPEVSGELVEGWWRITDKQGRELARVEGATREEALATAHRIPRVRAAVRRDGGLASRPLWTSDLTPTA